MEPDIFCILIGQIEWLWYILGILTVFLIGVFWYTVIFPKTWVRVFNVDTSVKVSGVNMFVTIFGQFVATALLGLGLFLATEVSVWLAVILAAGICGWQKGSLKYQFARWGDYFRAAWITAGYTAIASTIFIVFSLI